MTTRLVLSLGWPTARAGGAVVPTDRQRHGPANKHHSRDNSQRRRNARVLAHEPKLV